jgi:hypothetical protein
MRFALKPAAAAVTHAFAIFALTACGGGEDSSTVDVTASEESSERTMSALATTTWTTIAREGQSFSFSGTKVVRYGADPRWGE